MEEKVVRGGERDEGRMRTRDDKQQKHGRSRNKWHKLKCLT